MAGSKASGKGNVVGSDSESESRHDTEITSTMTRKKSRASTRRSRANRRPSISQHHIKHFVEHNYHDHKHDPVQLPVANDPQKGLPKRSGHKGGVSTPFPEKLHELLENVEQDDIVGWQPHGYVERGGFNVWNGINRTPLNRFLASLFRNRRAFVVHKPKEFVSDIMPQ